MPDRDDGSAACAPIPAGPTLFHPGSSPVHQPPQHEARLWAAPGFNPADYARQPFALELVYDRKLEGEAIAERSIAEMRRVEPFSEDRGRQWLRMMKQAFPDVVAQDRLLGMSDGTGKVVFLHNGRETAAINDALYARLFFGIWLSEQTSAPALRAALLGLG